MSGDAEYLAGIAACLEPEAAKAVPDTDGQIRLSIALSLKRIADSLDRIGACADGIHPSAFRIIKQEG